MTTYTLSIEDRVGTGVNVTERAVMIMGEKAPLYVASYNPNKETGAFNSKGPFDTSFSIVHPFREAARAIAYCGVGVGVGLPEVKYDSSVNDAQRILFGNLFKQEYETLKQQKPVTPQKRTYGALPPPEREHEIGMTAAEISAKRNE